MLKRHIKRALMTPQSNKYKTLNWIEVSRANLLHNYELFKRQNSNQHIIPVLKGNAYGHGLRQAAEIFNDSDCEFVAVDGYFEADQIIDSSRYRILVLGYINPENVHLLNVKKCSFVVQDIAGLSAFGKLKQPVNIHLELNTGMNRMGLSAEELGSYLDELAKHENLKLEGVMSHLADADNSDNSFTAGQVKLFDNLVEEILRRGFEPKFYHIAQTAGSLKAKSRYANTARIGIGLYGINPTSLTDPKHDNLADLKPALELKSTVVKVIKLKKGDRVSYSGTYTANKPMKIGILPLGYYEAIPRELSSKGIISYNDNRLPIVGRICMNHTAFDLKDSDIGVGSVVTVISADKTEPNSIDQIVDKFGLFSYTLLVNLSSTIRRKVI